METRTISIEQATALATGLLRGVGFPVRDADIIAAHLVAAERRGYPGHGLRRLLGICGGSYKVSDSSSNTQRVDKRGFLLFDGQGRLGISAVEDAIRDAVTSLDECASVVFGVIGYGGTTGSLGVYGSRLADRGVTSILMCNSEFAVAPHGSARAVLGTNPITVSMPGNPTSFSADVATAAWSYGSIKDVANAGKPVPLGVVQTEAGAPSVDPNDADRGSQLPMAGHKGYALGLAIELLCGPLLGAKAGRDAVKGSDGFLGILLRTDAARPADEVNNSAQALFTEIRRGPLSEGSSGIRIPGERAATSAQHKTVDIPEALMAQLETLRGVS